MRHLEIGPSTKPAGRKGWDRLGSTAGRWITHIGQWGQEPLPFGDEQYDLVYAAYVLEHIPWFRTHEALREVLRVLKHGGTIELWVPDFKMIVSAYLSGIPSDDGWKKHDPKGDLMKWVNGRIFSYGPGDHWHRSCYDEDHLTACLAEAGFRCIQRLPPDAVRGHAKRRPTAFGMKGTRP